MITVSGHWYDGQTSARVAATLAIQVDGSYLLSCAADGTQLSRGDFRDITVSSRLGNTPRYLYFGDGQKLETLDNDAVDKAQEQFKPSFWGGLAYRLETHFRFVVLTLVLVLGFGWWMVNYGVPASAKLIASTLPDKVLVFASEQTMDTLDRLFLEPSALGKDTRKRLQAHFRAAIDAKPELNIKVAFRAGDGLGANAFALPDGTVIFTDEIVALAEHDDELLAVLGHEIGHVEHRHGMRSLVQDSLLGFLLLMITGDTSATAEIFMALPIVLTELAYSRDFELEADDDALKYLRDNQIPPQHFANLMVRLEADAKRRYQEESGEQASGDEDDSDDWKYYLSTHPSTAERLEKFK